MEKRSKMNFGDFSNDFMVVVRDYWERFLFLLPNILVALLILFITIWIASKVHRLLAARLGGKAHDQITSKYIALACKWGVMAIGLLLVLHTLGLSAVAGTLLASAGVSALVVGFAFKDIAENFLAGIILAFNRPFEINDAIKVNDIVGKVLSMDLRTTHIRSFDSKDIFVPNSTILNAAVTNYTHNGLLRMDFIVGIDYNNNIQEAIDLIEKTALNVEGVLQKDPPFATVDELGTNTVNLKVFFYTETDDYKKGVILLRGKIIQEVTKALLDNGFGLPANIQELKLYDYQKNIPIKLMQNEPQQN